jgi:cell division protein FtsI/penicillin-binding protein 2
MRTDMSDTQKRRVFHQRIDVVLGVLLVVLLVIVARLIELQIIRGKEYEDVARAQHFGGIVLPARRGEVLSRNSKTKETNILATNTTLDLLYVDPFVTKDKRHVARLLAETILTTTFDLLCRDGSEDCPREFREYYLSAFDPFVKNPLRAQSGGMLLVENRESQNIPQREDIQLQFAVDIEKRINEEFVNFVPLLYGATKVQVRTIQNYGIPGIYASEAQKLIYVNPLHIPDYERHRIARVVSPVLGLDIDSIREKLRQRRLRYIPIFRRLPPELSKTIKKLKLASATKAAAERSRFLEAGNTQAADSVSDDLRGIALIPEHWRIYPDGTIASQVVGFLNIIQQPQNGIERTFNYELRGQEGRIRTLTDPFGGQIVSDDQSVVQALDGKSIILTIDRYVQKKVETILQRTIELLQADSAQIVIMEPQTGRIIAMANAPLVDGNNYSMVYEKVPAHIAKENEPQIVVEIYHPQHNALVIRSYINDLTPEGRSRLSRELQKQLQDLEELYDLDDLTRYYLYIGENSRIELFPVMGTNGTREWLKYKNRIGVGAYINRTVQEIYEPGSVFKPITMAIAIDQGEVIPEDTYVDMGSVEIDDYVITNAGNRIFGKVTMTDCMSFSINTCMTSVSRKLGKKLFANYIERFGFGKITGIQLEDEKPGNILDWRRWSDALLATAAYGQGISATPIQMVTAFGSLANGGRLVKPTIIDSWIDPDGTVHPVHPQVLEQVVTEESAATVTAILVKGMNTGFAKGGKVKGYRMAGKTGTSQIAGPGGKYEQAGSGSSIATFAGYAPADNPKFVMMIKIDRPRTREYGAVTAAPVFREISEILFEYYGIPPDEN